MKVEISKTLFKEYSKCENYYLLNQIYKRKGFAECDENIKNKYLNLMFSSSGDDLVYKEDKMLKLMQEYYKDVERVALKVASKVFKKQFKYDQEKQQQIKFIDANGYLFYTYLDGYYEDDQDIYIIEVKSTTNGDFLKAGPTEKGKLTPLFVKDGCVLTLNNDLDNHKKLIKVYQKVFDRYNDQGKYFYDIAVTSFIMKESLKQKKINKNVHYYLGILNSKYEYDGVSDYDEVNGEEVISFINCDRIVSDYQQIIFNDYEKVVSNLLNKSINSTYLKACKENCSFKNVCFSFLKEKNCIETLLTPKNITIGNNQFHIDELINMGYHKLTDIPKEYVTHPDHIIQRDVIDSGKMFFDKQAVRNSIDKNIKYPIYHLDFESFQSPLPRFYKEVPYMHMVFQFSIHVQKKPLMCDEEKDHYSFLAADHLDHREELVKALTEIIDLDDGGIVLVYNKSFECTRLLELMKIYPKYYNKLKKIYDHIVDLVDIVKRGKGEKDIHIYHEDLQGSFSIKKVLPVFTNLSYNNLEVKNGLEAQEAYLLLSKLSNEDSEKLRSSLIKYCCQDTYAMVKILNELYKKSQE